MARWFVDGDGDGFGGGGGEVACEQPAGTAAAAGDCDDTDATVYPGAVDECDGVDSNCDGVIDDGAALMAWFTDEDDDGYGDPAAITVACAQPAGTVDNGEDCNDRDASQRPGAGEVCDEVDNDCDGDIDDMDAGVDLSTGSAFYADRDGDGHGDPAAPVQACAQPSGHVPGSADCDDTDASVSPSAREVCDELDNDCDGFLDEGVQTIYYSDSDGDGYGSPGIVSRACVVPTGYAANDLDCDDSDSAIYPGQDEPCYCEDGSDNDSDGLVDCEDADCAGHSSCYESGCEDGVDNDSDGLTDCRDDDCWGLTACEQTPSAWVNSGVFSGSRVERTRYLRYYGGHGSYEYRRWIDSVAVAQSVTGSVRLSGSARSTTVLCGWSLSEATWSGEYNVGRERGTWSSTFWVSNMAAVSRVGWMLSSGCPQSVSSGAVLPVLLGVRAHRGIDLGDVLFTSSGSPSLCRASWYAPARWSESLSASSSSTFAIPSSVRIHATRKTYTFTGTMGAGDSYTAGECR